MSDPIKISIKAIFQFFFFQCPSICQVYVVNWLTIALLGSLSHEVRRMTQFGKTYKLRSLVKYQKLKLPGILIILKKNMPEEESNYIQSIAERNGQNVG